MPLDPVAPRRDDLDDLIDELLPDVDERPGWFDAGLLAVGAMLLAGGLTVGAPSFVLVGAVFALTLGCVLPLRTAWRRLAAGRAGRRRSARLASGVPVDVTSPITGRLVAAYEALLRVEGVRDGGAPAVAAAHGALLEAATLLGGRAPTSVREQEYVDRRTAAIEALAAALTPTPAEMAAGGEPSLLVDVRDEVEEMAGLNAVSRLDELAEEARLRRHGPA
ncbi:MAG: hypothetical protein QOG43_706 [Actinomycetota bacterium]|nr:hypothetical protein [Actinomycetota bacterium]